jgi:hypothetical protein
MPFRPEKAKKLKDTSQPEKKRATTSERGYGKIHKGMRDQLLATYPICQQCNNAFSTQAHHKRYGPDLTINDYLAVCNLCHYKLHKGEI